MRLYRPTVPVQICLDVALRQLAERGTRLIDMGQNWSTRAKLACALKSLFGDQPYQLDHDPPLMLRKFNRKTLLYKPHANDPDYLAYRTKEDHRLKTYVRGDGAKYSDAAERRRAIRRKKRKDEGKPKHRWPKGRKLKSRSTFARRP